MPSVVSCVIDKIRAAESVLNHSAKAIELEDIDVRVTELERAARDSKQSG